jgi:hypothetical protein
MNKQFFIEHNDNSDNPKDPEMEENRPVEHSDNFTGTPPMWEKFDQQTRSEAVPNPDADSMNEAEDHEIQPAKMPQTRELIDAPLPTNDPMDAKPGSGFTVHAPEESELLHKRWNEIQGEFVDDPHRAVQQANELVAELVEKTTQMLAKEKSTLESEWKPGNNVSTEELRQTMQHYRSFFNHLVV